MPRVDCTKAKALLGALKNLPDKPDQTLWHTGTPKGFGLRVRRGRQDWVFQYRSPETGKSRKMTLGAFGVGAGGLPPAVAHRIANEHYVVWCRGIDPNPAKEAAGSVAGPAHLLDAAGVDGALAELLVGVETEPVVNPAQLIRTRGLERLVAHLPVAVGRCGDLAPPGDVRDPFARNLHGVVGEAGWIGP